MNITRVWNQPYSVIHQANSLLERIESGAVVTDDAVALNCIKAEALALRGLALFDLTRLFAMPYTLNNGTSLGVPIEIKTTLLLTSLPATTVAECYQQVIDDMTGALNSRHSLLIRKTVILMYGVSKHYFHAYIFI